MIEPCEGFSAICRCQIIQEYYHLRTTTGSYGLDSTFTLQEGEVELAAYKCTVSRRTSLWNGYNHVLIR